jgi:hypothetical protein
MFGRLAQAFGLDTLHQLRLLALGLGSLVCAMLYLGVRRQTSRPVACIALALALTSPAFVFWLRTAQAPVWLVMVGLLWGLLVDGAGTFGYRAASSTVGRLARWLPGEGRLPTMSALVVAKHRARRAHASWQARAYRLLAKGQGILGHRATWARGLAWTLRWLTLMGLGWTCPNVPMAWMMGSWLWLTLPTGAPGQRLLSLPVIWLSLAWVWSLRPVHDDPWAVWSSWQVLQDNALWLLLMGTLALVPWGVWLLWLQPRRGWTGAPRASLWALPLLLGLWMQASPGILAGLLWLMLLPFYRQLAEALWERRQRPALDIPEGRRYGWARDITLAGFAAGVFGLSLWVFQVLPDAYPGTLWTLPGIPMLNEIRVGNKVLLDTGAPLMPFPLWKLWGLPLLFWTLGMLAFGLTVRWLEVQNRRLSTVWVLGWLGSWWALLLLGSVVLAPVVARPVAPTLAQHIQQGPGRHPATPPPHLWFIHARPVAATAPSPSVGAMRRGLLPPLLGYLSSRVRLHPALSPHQLDSHLGQATLGAWVYLTEDEFFLLTPETRLACRLVAHHWEWDATGLWWWQSPKRSERLLLQVQPLPTAPSFPLLPSSQ